MRGAPRLMLAVALLSLLGGCTYVDKVTGQTNDKVLPGQREEAIPGRPTFPDKADPLIGQASQPAGGSGASGCAANDPACKPPATTNDTFQDPQ